MKCVQWLLLLTAVNDCVDGNDDAARLWSLDAQHHDHPNTNRTRSPKWFEALPTPPCPSDWNESQAQLADDIAMVRRHALLRAVACSSSVRNRTTATPPRAFFNDDSTGQPRGWLALCRRCVSEGFCDDEGDDARAAAHAEASGGRGARHDRREHGVAGWWLGWWSLLPSPFVPPRAAFFVVLAEHSTDALHVYDGRHRDRHSFSCGKRANERSQLADR